MDFSSYESSNELLEPEWSAVASALPSVFDSAAISDPLIRDDDLFEASKIHSLPRVDIESDTLFEFQPIFLGAGASYRVYMQKFKQWGKPVAVKHIKSTASEGNIENFPSLGRQRLTVLREIYSLCLFNGHPNITNLLAWGQHNLGELTAFLITDYASLGSLDSFLRENRGGLKADHLFKICANVAEGIHAMHSQRMVHGDVKTANILIFEDACDRGQFTAKISDLGFSISLDFDDGDACYRGTNLYNAPEVKGQGSRRLQDLDFLACDVYSYGLLVWSVFKYGDFFLKDLSTFTVGDSSEEQMLDSVSALQLLEHAVEFAWARDSRDEAKVLNDVLSACLQADPVARLSIRSICRILNASAPQLSATVKTSFPKNVTKRRFANPKKLDIFECQRLWYPQKIKQQLAQKLLSAAENPKNPKGADLAFEVSKCFAIAFGFSKDIQSMESWLSIAANRGHKFAKALATKLKISGLQVTQDEELRSPNAPNATPFGIVQPHQPRNHRDDFETEDSSLFAAAVVGDIQEVGAFLKEVGHDMTAEQFFGAVEYATMSLHATVCDIILRRAFQSFPVLPNSPFGSIVKGSLYLWMLFHGKRWVEALDSVIRVLLSHGFDINDYDEGGMTAMGYAVMLHEPVVASTLRAYGASLEQKSKNGYTVLHYAIGGVSNSENIGCVRWLLDYDDPLVPFTHEQRGQLKWSGGPLHIASMHNAHGAAKAILEYTNVDVNGRSSDGDTPLHVACSRNALEMVQLLLHHGADATAVDNGKSTPLEKAVHGISIEVVEYLLSRDVPIYNTRSTPPRSILAYYAGLREPGRTRLSQLLLRYTQSRSPEILHRKNATGRQVLGTAVVAKNDDFVLDLINAGAEIGSPHEPDSEWRSLISNHSRIDYYSAGDSRQVRQYLRTLQAFVDIFKQQDTLEACNSDGKTLLFTAALCGNVAAVTVLLDAGLSARSTDSQGSTILHDALLGAFYLSPADLLDRPVEWFGEKEPAKDRALVDILHLLLNAGADPNAETSGGVRPLHIAVMVAWRLKSTALVELLCERGAHSDAPALGWYGVRPLHIALEAPTFVKAWGVDPSWPSMRVLSDKEANARDTQDVEMVRALVRVLSGAGASFKTFRGWGVHATTEAVRKCNPIGLRAMLAEGVEVYKALETGQAACHYAAQWVEAAGRQRDQTQEPRLIQSSSAWLKARLAAGMENVEVLHEYPDILM